MPPHRTNTYDLEAAVEVRRQAEEEASIFYPRAEVSFGYVNSPNHVMVKAEVRGDTTPFSYDEVREHLSDLGIRATFPELNQPETL